MHISNNSPLLANATSYNTSKPSSKEVDVLKAVTFLADHIGSDSAQHVKDVLQDQLNQNPLFMAGIGIKSLGYTFLLLQMYSQL